MIGADVHDHSSFVEGLMMWGPRTVLLTSVILSGVQAVRLCKKTRHSATSLRLAFVAVWSAVNSGTVAYGITVDGFTNEFVIPLLTVSVACIVGGWAWVAYTAVTYSNNVTRRNDGFSVNTHDSGAHRGATVGCDTCYSTYNAGQESQPRINSCAAHWVSALPE